MKQNGGPYLSLVAALLTTFSTPAVFAQTKNTPAAPADLSWIRDFAAPSTPESQANDEAGKQNQLNWDP